jgi:pantoate--beta-alanine ligase
MQTITAVKDMQALGRQLRTKGKTIGLIPTMGALHEGHLSLVRQSKRENDLAVVSIFVNPAQFGPKEDFSRYPRDKEGDLLKLSDLKVEAVFVPEDNEMYGKDSSISVHTGRIGEILCGLSRPGHFNGVALVVAKLFNIIKPHKAYFGQKDYQQTVIIKKLVLEMNFDIDIVICPTVREDDGLAMSSRNSYLKPEERKAATALFRSLQHGKGLIHDGVDETARIKGGMGDILKSEPLVNVEYISIADPRNLNEMERVHKPAVISLAVKIGKTRLIDNLIIE